MTRRQKQAAREQRFRELIILYALLRKQQQKQPDQEYLVPEFYFGAHEDDSV